jgi:hypothetical protein
VLLAIVTLAVYWPVRLNGFINYDDGPYVVQNQHVRQGLTWDGAAWAFRSRDAFNWHPLTWLSHMLDVELFGMDAGLHHLTNVGFHAANAVLLFLLLRKLTGALWKSALVAALFAVHPLHVESVAWVSERKDVLSTCFGLLCLWAYAGYVAPTAGHRQMCYALALVFFVLALMSKPMLVTLPFVMLLLDYWPLGRFSLSTLPEARKPLRRLMLEKAPFLAMAAASCLVTSLAQTGAMHAYAGLSLRSRVANAAISCVRYLAKTLWPHNLSIIYLHPLRWQRWQNVSSLLLLATLTGLILWRARRQPYLAVGWFWFLGMLVPVLGLVQVGLQAMADRYTYLPVVGIFVMVVWAGADWEGSSKLRVGLGTVLALLALAGCVGITRVQLGYWRDTRTLFEHALAITDNNWAAHHNLALFALVRYQETKGNSIAPQLEFPEFADLHASSNPQDYLNEVVLHSQAALRLRPDFPPAHVTLAKALTEQGKFAEAKAQLEIAVRLDPVDPEAHQLLVEISHRLAKQAVGE